MWKFSKREREGSVDRVAAHIAAFILKTQFRLAAWLASKEKRLTHRQKKVAFLLLGLLAMLWIAYLFAGVMAPPDPHRIRAEWLMPSRDTTVQKRAKAGNGNPLLPRQNSSTQKKSDL